MENEKKLPTKKKKPHFGQLKCGFIWYFKFILTKI